MSIFLSRIKTVDSTFVRARCLVFFVLFFSTSLSFGQYGLSVGANYVHAFGDRNINFQNTMYDLNATNGYEITLNNHYQFPNTRIQALLEVGFRQLYFSGNSSTLSYSGQHNKLIGAIGTRYELAEKMGVSGFIEVENNRVLDDFNLGDGDLFRVCLSLESSYFITENLGFTALVSRAMTPITEAYIITNPQYQVRLGLVYRFIK